MSGKALRSSLVALPARARAGDRVDAVLGERRDQPRQVAVVLCDRVRLPQLADRLVLGGICRPVEQLEDAFARHDDLPFGG
jgi:hypothetical protein